MKLSSSVGVVMRSRSAAFGLSFVFTALVGSAACLAQAAPATDQAVSAPGTLQDAAVAHQRGDFASARAIFESLAAQGNVTAQFDLAVMNVNGQGGPANLQEALKWYRAAAEQGDAESFSSLAALFENGSGVTPDYVKAYVLYDAAARLARGNAVQAARAQRDLLSAKMATAQLIQAQDIARQCQAVAVKACSQRILSGEDFTPGNQALDTPMVIKLEQDHGIFVAPVTVNGNMSLKFAVDSGASSVTIPQNVIDALMTSGALSKSDFTGETTVQLADGSKRKVKTIRLRSLKLGDLVLDNVNAQVAPANAPMLLGQSFLTRLKSWSLDNANHTLTMK